MIGEKRAHDIVTYRERHISDHPASAAFEKPEDLLAIRGIGASILQQIRPYLVFPSDRPTTRQD
jgi:DNA uptake protein ComE-like DNA-binding protein